MPAAFSGEKQNMEKRMTPSSAKRRQSGIGDKLRQIYDDVVNEPVPDDFLNLLKDADEAASKRSEKK